VCLQLCNGGPLLPVLLQCLHHEADGLIGQPTGVGRLLPAAVKRQKSTVKQTSKKVSRLQLPSVSRAALCCNQPAAAQLAHAVRWLPTSHSAAPKPSAWQLNPLLAAVLI
jgi:hypothetical protein